MSEVWSRLVAEAEPYWGRTAEGLPVVQVGCLVSREREPSRNALRAEARGRHSLVSSDGYLTRNSTTLIVASVAKPPPPKTGIAAAFAFSRKLR